MNKSRKNRKYTSRNFRRKLSRRKRSKSKSKSITKRKSSHHRKIKRKKSKPRSKSSHRKRDGMMNEESNVIYSWPSHPDSYEEDIEDFKRYTLTIIKNPGSDESVGTLVIKNLEFGDCLGIQTINFKNKDSMKSYIINKTKGCDKDKDKAKALLLESEELEEKFVKPAKH